MIKCRHPRQLLRLALHLLTAQLFLLPCSCEYLPGYINEESLREYHDGRMLAVGLAYLGEQGYESGEPPKPLPPEFDDNYRKLALEAKELAQAFEEASDSSDTAVQYCAEVLDVLRRRDAAYLEKLAPDIETHRQALKDADRKPKQRAVSAAEESVKLSQSWDGIWREHQLDCSLKYAESLAVSSLAQPVNDLRAEALSTFHLLEFSRLATTYILGTDDDTTQSHVPQGCDDLAYAIRRYEAALYVKSALTKAMQEEAEVLADYSDVDPNELMKNFDGFPNMYERRKGQTAAARLQLMQVLLEMTESAEEYLFHNMREKWQMAWPGHSLEMDLRAYAEQIK